MSLLRYVDGDYRDEGTFTQLRKELGRSENPAHYLAIPPSMFSPVAQGLGKSGCAKGARVIVEKPFGRDLESARALNSVLHEVFDESSVFRIVEPILNMPEPPQEYESGSWGPTGANGLIAPHGVWEEP